jgi:hypothetical protein
VDRGLLLLLFPEVHNHFLCLHQLVLCVVAPATLFRIRVMAGNIQLGGLFDLNQQVASF